MYIMYTQSCAGETRKIYKTRIFVDSYILCQKNLAKKCCKVYFAIKLCKSLSSNVCRVLSRVRR